jgi:hypothetical protein
MSYYVSLSVAAVVTSSNQAHGRNAESPAKVFVEVVTFTNLENR